REGDRLDAVRVAEEALGLDRPIEMVVAPLVAGGHVPPILLAVPGDGRLEQPAVALEEGRDSPGAPSQGVGHLRLHTRQDPPLLVAPGLAMDLPAAAPFDREVGGAGLERDGTVRPIAATAAGGDRSQRPAHRMAAERLGDVSVATGAGRSA